MSASGDTVLLQRDGAIARIVMARAEAGDALRGADVQLLMAHMQECVADSAVRVIVLTGSGSKFFCSGGDIAELAGGLPDIGVHIRKWLDLADQIEASEKPVIAAINGVAVGGGLELALACHHRLAVTSARLGLPELGVGLFPSAGGIGRLTRLVGAARAVGMILSRDVISAETARQSGIVDRVCPVDELAVTVNKLALRFAAHEPNAVRATLMCARAAALGKDGNDLVVALLRECYATPRNREVLQQFLGRLRDKAHPPDAAAI